MNPLRWLGVNTREFWLLMFALAGFTSCGLVMRDQYVQNKKAVQQLAEYKQWVKDHPIVVQVPFPVHDTTVVHDTLPTIVDTVHAGTRIASFQDSTYAGVITGTVTAPPTGPLGISYLVQPHPFDPQITVTEDSVIAEWRGTRASVGYTRPEPPHGTPPHNTIVVAQPLRFLGWSAEALTTPSFDRIRVAAGIALRPRPGRTLLVQMEDQTGAGPALTIGVRIEH